MLQFSFVTSAVVVVVVVVVVEAVVVVVVVAVVVVGLFVGKIPETSQVEIRQFEKSS